MLQGKNIVVGICGSIAAYKSAHLVRLLVKEGAKVRVVMTNSATEFITPLTLSTLSKNPVQLSFVKNNQGEWNNHVEIGLWADLIVIAPASANTLTKMATGLCDNLLTAVYLSARCPVVVAPAMDLDMYQHKSTLRNLKQLKKDGVQVIEANYGELASGLTGTGRMAEPEEIFESISRYLSDSAELKDKTVLITAGPTVEAIDPVRYISNHSSGKMGYALAEEMAGRGAKIILISGPTACVAEHKNIDVVKVHSAEEMNDKATSYYPQAEIAILAAAVADYTPEAIAKEKIKKTEANLTIKLKKTPDIAHNLGVLKKNGQINIGFALETENELENAKAKLQKKNLDLIVLNSLKDEGAGFGHETNKISIIDKQNNIEQFELKDKRKVAYDIINAIVKILP
ncbi:MAG: bifunctional phosphopantothenoylcysteine decarboxylase/phosphopantothenate--cysteine ligase CoaBC [Candidatus Cyclobacteriaceae bacterium M2_1C_046]